MRFLEALRYAHGRGVVLPAEYYQRMTDAQRQASVSIAGLAQLEQIEHVMRLVNEAIANGSTFAEFKKQVKQGKIALGLPDYRLDNIFRTNIQSAYNHGRWQQQQRIRHDRPYLMYDAVNDSRTRISHAVLDGTIRHIDDAFWDTHYPPNGYRCRCVTRSLTHEQMTAKGGETLYIDPQGKPDAGWATSPKAYANNLQELVQGWQSKQAVSIESYVRLNEAKERIVEQLSNHSKGAKFVDFSKTNVDEAEVERLLFDSAKKKADMAEARNAVQFESYYQVKLNRFAQKFDDKGNPIPSPDFYVVGADQSIDFLFATYRLSEFKKHKLNEYFADTEDRWYEKKQTIQEHLDKADIVPIDLRDLSLDNRSLLIGYVLSLPIEQQQQIILIMGD